MVKENLIPIENKKPFETVYELKNEIPSFEEFMKDYQADENLNYDDLNSGSVGEVKGYGPCIINGNLNYDNCRCSSEELDRQLKIIRNKRELEALEREKRESERSASVSINEALGRSGNVPVGSVAGSAAFLISKLFD